MEEQVTLSGILTRHHVLLLDTSKSLFASQALIFDRVRIQSNGCPDLAWLFRIHGWQSLLHPCFSFSWT